VKNKVYRVQTNDLQHLKAHIRDAVAMVTPNMLQATWDEVDIVWIFVVPPRELTLEFTEKVIYSERALIVLLCNGVMCHFSMALPAHSGLRSLIQFRNHFSQTVGLLGRVSS
jgi:hypothetical protein